MARPKGEKKVRIWVPERLLGQIEELIGRDPSARKSGVGSGERVTVIHMTATREEVAAALAAIPVPPKCCGSTTGFHKATCTKKGRVE